MPASYEMSWEPRSRRWWKQQHGKRHVISCRQLKKLGYLEPDASETKEGSYRAANRWWEDAARGKAPGRPAAIVRVEFRDMDTGEPTGVFVDIPHEEHEARLAENTERKRAVLDLIHRQPVPKDRSVGALADLYLDKFKSRHLAGEISAAEVNDARYALHAFRDWVGAGADVGRIDYALMERWWTETLRADFSAPKKKKRVRFAKSFVKWLARRGLVPAMDLDDLRVKYTPPAVPMPDLEEVRRIVAEATGQMRLHLLLMLNCAFSQIDVASLTRDEVDWTRGRIRRKRTKTRKQKGVPEVNYPLWAGTFSLLQQHRQAEGDLALLTPSGKRWLRDAVDGEGNRRKVDQIGTDYKYLKKRIKATMRLGIFRKVGANLLADEPRFAPLAQRFLGHAPSTVMEKHYTSDRAGQAHFDEAVRWVGEKLGLS